ncbi:MAG: hypothetical protein ABW019_04830 [Chitinophagaceae bacterium]
MRKALFLACMFAAYSAFGQNVVDVDKNGVALSNRVFYSAGGHPVSAAKYVRLASGSPYFSEKWMKGAIGVDDSTKYADIRLRLDLVDNTVIYLNDKNEEMVSVATIRQIYLRDTTNGQSYLFTHSSAIPGHTDKAWYQVLSTGAKATLYKQYSKTMVESKAYASSVTEQTIRTEERYFVAVNNTLARVKKIKDIIELVPDKKTELADYAQKSKLSGKKESDFVALIEYYNSL